MTTSYTRGSIGLLDQFDPKIRASILSQPNGRAQVEEVFGVSSVLGLALVGAFIVAPVGALVGWAAGHALAGLGIGAAVGGAVGGSLGYAVSNEFDAVTDRR